MFRRGIQAISASICRLRLRDLALIAAGSYLLRSHFPRLWGYQPMSAEDALYAASFPVSIVTVGLLGKTTTAQVRADLENRVLPGTIRARQYYTSFLGKAFWTMDKKFSIDDHLVTVSTPITSMEELSAFASVVSNQQLPPHKPHWCAYLVEDYAEGSALIVHTHHAYIDGTALVDALVHHADPHCMHDFYATSQSSVLWKALRMPLALLLLPYTLLSPMFLPPQHNPLIEGSRSLERSVVFSPPMSLAPY